MINLKLSNTLTDNGLLAVTFLGFFSGFPLLLTGSTLQAWAVSMGLDLTHVGALSLLGMPYLLKWLWAPVIDSYNNLSKTSWLFITQLGVACSLLLMALVVDNLSYWQIAAGLCALFAATQDLVIDAYKIELLEKPNYGMGSALSCIGFRLAMMVSGGLLLILADYVGWQFTYIFAAAIMMVFIFVSQLLPSKAAKGSLEKFSSKQALLDLLSKPQIGWWLLLVVTYRFVDVVLVNLGGAFLLNHCGLSLTAMGSIYKIFGVIAVILGSIVAGRLLKFFDLKQLLYWGAVAQALSLIPFVVTSYLLKVSWFWCGLIVGCESFCSGLAVTFLMALLMQWCNMRYLATQFAWLTALVAIPRVLLGGSAGKLVELYSWSGVFWGLLGFAVLVVLLLGYINIKRVVMVSGEANEN